VSKISLSDISKIGSKRILDYREISEQHPYCACSKVLYLLSLKKLDDPDFNKTLSQTAISVPDRKFLASLIEGLAPVKTIAVNNTSASNSVSDRFFSFTPVFEDEKPTATTTPTASTISDTFFRQQKPVSVESVVDLLGGEKKPSGTTAPSTQTISARNISLSHTDGRTSINSYINKFLDSPQEHKLIKVDANKDYSKIKIDQSSLKEDLSFGTEAIARLYAQQGNPQKAIEIYYNLMEKHPEKVLYYSSLIRKLRV
jgi:hypothetical protein